MAGVAREDEDAGRIPPDNSGQCKRSGQIVPVGEHWLPLWPRNLDREMVKLKRGNKKYF